MTETSTIFDIVIRAAERAGGYLVSRLRYLLEIFDLFGKTAHSAFTSPSLQNPAIRSVLLKQFYFSGLEAWKIIMLVALILGAIIISQVVGVMKGVNASLTGKVLVWVVFRELGPLLTALIVIARSGTAIATELGSMKINGEIGTLELLGIPPERYLILPRVISVFSSVVVLTIYFILTSLAGGYMIASFGYQIPYYQFTQGIVSSLGIREVVAATVKASSFGLVIAPVCCHAGLSVGTSATEIPQAATKAVINSLLAVFLLDGIITFLSSLLINA